MRTSSRDPRPSLRFHFRTLLLVPVAVFCALQAHFAASPEREEGGPEQPSDYFFIQRALPDGTIPSERIAQAVEELLFERELQRQQLGTSAAQDWTPVGPYGIGGRVNSIVAAPGGTPAYLGSANGGVWRSNNFGVNWSPLTDRLGIFSVGALAITPNNPNRVWCGTGDANGTIDGYDGTGLFLTRDGGSTWLYRGLRETSHIAAVALDPSDTSRIYVGALGKSFTTDSNRGLYRSTNAGKISAARAVRQRQHRRGRHPVNPAHPESVYAATWERVRRPTYRRAYGPGCAIWRSVNGGDTWTKIVNGLPPADDNLGRITIALAPSRPSRLYASLITGAFSAYVGNGLYRSDDGGDTWQRVDDITTTHANAFDIFGWYFGRVTVSPVDPDNVWVCGVAVALHRQWRDARHARVLTWISTPCGWTPQTRRASTWATMVASGGPHPNRTSGSRVTTCRSRSSMPARWTRGTRTRSSEARKTTERCAPRRARSAGARCSAATASTSW